MERDRILRFTPVDHPDIRVRRVGFDLRDPYVEQCWSAVVGPSSTLLLRRMPDLWATNPPGEIEATELSRSLGLGLGVGDRSRLMSTMNRLVQYRLARPVPDGAGLEVFRQVSPLTPHQLGRVPQWTRDTHERLLGTHLEQFEDIAQHQANVASITARLDRIQNGTSRSTNGIATHGQAVER
ncbi:MAG: hypothetical protein KDB13_00310 [Microthrixaceae bacterium]|nr:hypothetical protein [Microthrixaceae bacterium]MCB1010643.1 hypothetical protein [Microthrixaceae bacterium]MCO5307151.1 hypothetical protein [Microthrixaceae bacterium]